MYFLDFVEKAYGTSSPNELFRLFFDAAKQQRLPHVIFGQITGTDFADLFTDERENSLLLSPTSWPRLDGKTVPWREDPVVSCAPYMNRPYTWEMLRRAHKLTERQVSIRAMLNSLGVSHILSVPLHGPRDNVCVASFYAPHGEALHAPQLYAPVYALATQFYVILQTHVLAHPSALLGAVPDLSGRERECLQWSAYGKSSWDIGIILGISSNTVNFHLKNAMRKLGTNSRRVAVVSAIGHGIIRPQQSQSSA